MRALLTLTVLAALATSAHADDRWSFIDKGDHVEVTVHGVTATTPTVSAVRERLEIPLSGQPAGLESHVTDATLREIDIRDHAPRVLSIELHFDHAGVVTLAPHATVTQTGDTLRVSIPRALPVTKPIPAKTPATATATATPTATATVTATATPTVTATATPTVTATATPTPTATAKPTTRPTPPPPAPITTPSPSPQVPITSLVIGGAASLLGLAAFLRRRRKKSTPTTELDVIAARSLGGKAKVVWLAAGDREIVVAVTPQSVRLLSQWKRPRSATRADDLNSDATAGADPAFAARSPRLPTATASPTAAAVNSRRTGTFASLASAAAASAAPTSTASTDDDGPADSLDNHARFADMLARIEPPRTRTEGSRVGPLPRAQTHGQSPAVDGILRLRERGQQLADDVSTEDPEADQQWARDILATIGTRR